MMLVFRNWRISIAFFEDFPGLDGRQQIAAVEAFPIFSQIALGNHLVQDLLLLNFLELGLDEVRVECRWPRLHAKQRCNIRCILLDGYPGEAHVGLGQEECHHSGRHGGEQKDEQDGYEPNANDPPIIQNMELVGGLICTWGFIHFLQPKKKGRPDKHFWPPKKSFSSRKSITRADADGHVVPLETTVRDVRVELVVVVGQLGPDVVGDGVGEAGSQQQ